MTTPSSPYTNLAIHAAVSASVASLSAFLSLPSLLLLGLYTYIHPDSLPAASAGSGGGLRAAIRRPGSSDQDTHPEHHRKKGKHGHSKSVFDDDANGNAQIFRLRLADSQLRTRIFFSAYRNSFVLSVAALSSLLLDRFAVDGAFVPSLLAIAAVLRLAFSLVRISFEGSATRASEKQLSVLSGFLGFFSSLSVLFVFSPSIFAFDFGEDGLARVSTAVLAGGLSGILFVPATRAARSFWVGTDQLDWNLPVISCGGAGRACLYVGFISCVFAASVSINPMVGIWRSDSQSDDVEALRVWALAVSGFAQVLALRPNLQMYLNEAVLSWYQRLHSKKVPDLDFGRAKIFLHNHYICLVILQFFGPGVLVLLLLGVSQIRGNSFCDVAVIGNVSCLSPVLMEMALFLAWWVVFVWSVFTSSTLALFRHGYLFI
ncbi:hypothetical protein QJS04_geneDACA010715 [Acorus gramineus]|uniref:Transmembrane protein n=1 Tax=Acorus gramineus TaxID=55184 RepID=A0AAV9BAY9_ACOGR|nr:hypothetical protein QJS04_geneDACA010715 [Acorus gramineus]